MQVVNGDGDDQTSGLNQWLDQCPQYLECHRAPIAGIDEIFGDTFYAVTDLRPQGAASGAAENTDSSPEDFCPSAARSDGLRDSPEKEILSPDQEVFGCTCCPCLDEGLPTAVMDTLSPGSGEAQGWVMPYGVIDAMQLDQCIPSNSAGTHWW